MLQLRGGMSVAIVLLGGLAACSSGRSGTPKPVDWDARLSHRAPSALHLAVLKRDRNWIEAILNRGGEVDPKAEGGATPLHYAAAIGYPDGIELLLARGADPGQLDEAGKLAGDYLQTDQAKEAWAAVLPASPPRAKCKDPSGPSQDPASPKFIRPEALIDAKVWFESPIYPALARRHNIEATVIVGFTLLPDGGAGELHFIKAHPLFNQEIIRIFRSWRFDITKPDIKVGARSLFKFTFKLEKK